MAALSGAAWAPDEHGNANARATSTPANLSELRMGLDGLREFSPMDTSCSCAGGVGDGKPMADKACARGASRIKTCRRGQLGDTLSCHENYRAVHRSRTPRQ